jgi:hypothetical protein
MKLDQTLSDYLRRIEQYEPQKLGGVRRPVTEEDSRFLRESLGRQLRFGNSMIIVAVVLLCSLFFLGVFLILYHRDSLNAVGVISGGTFASLLAIIGLLRRLWLEKSAMDLLIHASKGLPPAETAKLVTSFYFAATRRKARGGANARVQPV